MQLFVMQEVDCFLIKLLAKLGVGVPDRLFGIGDNPPAAEGRSNGALVTEAVAIAAEFGRKPASPDEAAGLLS